MPAGIGGTVVGSAKMVLGVDSTGLQSGTKAASSSLLGLGAAAGGAQKQIVKMFGAYVGAAALIGAVKKSTQAFIEFDRQLRNTHTLITATENELQGIGKEVRAMSRNFQTSASESQAALYQIYSATIYGSDAMTVLKESTKGAAAGLSGLMQTADMVTTVLNAYGMSASNAAYINDLLFTTVRYGKCLRKGTRVLLANGQYENIENLSGGADIVAFDGKSFIPRQAQWVYQGKKPIVRLVTKSGRKIDTTWTHPYLTENGWKKVSELKPGDRVVVPSNIPFFGSKHISTEKASFLGLWIAEGTGGATSPELSTVTYGNEIVKWAKAFGCHVSLKTQNNPKSCQTYVISSGKGSSPNPAMAFCEILV